MESLLFDREPGSCRSGSGPSSGHMCQVDAGNPRRQSVRATSMGGREAVGGILSIVQCSWYRPIVGHRRRPRPGSGIDGEMLDLSSSARPRLRGVWHKWACMWSVPFSVALVILADDARARVAVSIYAATLVALFGVSALYHRVDWSSISARRWMRRLDHSMIFMLIAGTYTPFALLALHGELALAILVTVWTGALAGVIFNLLWSNAPTWLIAVVYISLGWVAVAAVPQLAAALGVAGLALLGLGGLLYTAGGVIYAVKRPDPFPGVFGYHEVFHALVIGAAAIQYAVIAFWVLPG